MYATGTSVDVLLFKMVSNAKCIILSAMNKMISFTEKNCEGLFHHPKACKTHISLQSNQWEEQKGESNSNINNKT